MKRAIRKHYLFVYFLFAYWLRGWHGERFFSPSVARKTVAMLDALED